MKYLTLLLIVGCTAEGIEQEPWPCPEVYCVATTTREDNTTYSDRVCEWRTPYINERAQTCLLYTSDAADE